MGQKDEENPVSEDETKDEATAEKEKLRPNPLEEMEMTKIPNKTSHYPTQVIAGQDEPLIKSHHLKYLIFGFNFFITLLGLSLLAITIWMLADPEFFQYEATLKVDQFRAVLAMLITASLIILVVGVLGCMGAASERRWMLILYMAILGIIFLIEIAAVILMWSAPYSKTISGELQFQIKQQITYRKEKDTSREFIDFIQAHLKCCGSTSVKDYEEEVPHSCLDERTQTAFTEGCAVKMLSFLRSKAGIVGGIALPILLVQLLALLASGCLIKSLEVESRYFM